LRELIPLLDPRSLPASPIEGSRLQGPAFAYRNRNVFLGGRRRVAFVGSARASPQTPPQQITDARGIRCSTARANRANRGILPARSGARVFEERVCSREATVEISMRSNNAAILRASGTRGNSQARFLPLDFAFIAFIRISIRIFSRVSPVRTTS